MNKDLHTTIQSLNTNSFSDYKFLVFDIREIFNNYDEKNQIEYVKDRNIDGFTIRASNIKSAKITFNKKLAEFSNKFFWKGNEELIRNELRVNPQVLEEVKGDRWSFLMPLDFNEMEPPQGPSSINVMNAREGHFKDNLASGYYLKPYNNKVKEKEGCFIATYAFDNYNDPKVLILRNYRDQILQPNRFGKLFIRNYYKYSPSLIHLFQLMNFPKFILRFLISVLLKGLPSIDRKR